MFGDFKNNSRQEVWYACIGKILGRNEYCSFRKVLHKTHYTRCHVSYSAQHSDILNICRFFHIFFTVLEISTIPVLLFNSHCTSRS